MKGFNNTKNQLIQISLCNKVFLNKLVRFIFSNPLTLDPLIVLYTYEKFAINKYPINIKENNLKISLINFSFSYNSYNSNSSIDKFLVSF